MKHDYLIAHVGVQVTTVVQVKEQALNVPRVIASVSTDCATANILSQNPLYVANHTW